MEMNDRVVYKHIRLDNNDTFYIGMGTKKRPYCTTGRSEFWNRVVNKAGYKIEVLHKGLTVREAKDKEIELIKKYGRRDTLQGTLVNLTDGGDGSEGKTNDDYYIIECREFIESLRRLNRCTEAHLEKAMKILLDSPYRKDYTRVSIISMIDMNCKKEAKMESRLMYIALKDYPTEEELKEFESIKKYFLDKSK